jgi:hypothetical protein
LLLLAVVVVAAERISFDFCTKKVGQNDDFEEVSDKPHADLKGSINYK